MTTNNIPKSSEVIAKLKAGDKVPAHALRCTAEMPVAKLEADNTDKTIKVSMLGRTRDAIPHWFFGDVIHDMGSIQNLPSKVALNHSHGDQPIGYARPSIDESGLRLNGVITPPDNDPTHPAWDIANALKAGIPLEASIDFSAPYKLVELPEGVTAMVNGKSVTGPKTIIKDWSLRSCAACISGQDPGTSTIAQFAASDVAGISPTDITTFAMQDSATPTENKETVSDNQTISNLSAEVPAAVVDAQAETKTEMTVVEAPLAVETVASAPVVEAMTVDKPQSSANEVNELKETIQRLEARITAMSKPAVAPIPGVPMDKPKANSPQTWAQALDEVKKQNPHLDANGIVKLAAAKFGDLAVAARSFAYRSRDHV